MPSNVVHFDVAADDLGRASKFYEAVFNWRFEPGGFPDFFMITTGSDGDPGIHGALTKRRASSPDDTHGGFECTIAVDSIDATAAAIVRHGGSITYDKMTIAGVGTLVQFKDPEGNVVTAMQYTGEWLERNRSK
jgi:hypothetical protein